MRCSRRRFVAACGLKPSTSKETMPAESSGARGVTSLTWGMPASPSFSRVFSDAVRSATLALPIASWKANASASAH